MRSLACLAWLCTIVSLGCARPTPTTPADGAPWLDWQAPLGRTDAFAGRIYDTGAQRFITPGDAAARARATDYVLLGEKHDNPDHHRLQAWLITEIARDGRKPAVVLEMIPRDRAGALGAARTAHPHDPDALGVVLDWSASGWPPYALYRPVFAAALAAYLPLAPGDLTREELTLLRKGGLDALSRAGRDRLALDPPPSPETLARLAQEVRDAHCGMAPDKMIGAMIDIQRARDATLADALLSADIGDGAVLIAGAGHARRDPGAPVQLGRRAPAKSVLAIAFAEVPRPGDAPTDLAEAGAGFDLIWFTPRVDALDACEQFKHELEKMRAPPPEK